MAAVSARQQRFAADTGQAIFDPHALVALLPEADSAASAWLRHLADGLPRGER